MPHSRACSLRLRASSGKTGAVPSGFENESGPPAPRLFRFGPLVVALLGLLVAGACGPSVQSIYEGDVRFEHCYRLDLEVDTAPTHREACWKEWLAMYTYGQPRDRIEYARKRAQAFASGDTNRPSLNIDDSKKGEARQFYLVVPSPTSVHAPPPPVATRWYADAGSAPEPAAAPAATTEQAEASSDQCAAGCRGKLAQCEDNCADGGKAGPGCKNCDLNYKSCMRRCFQ
jgi:hypothetical protein